MGKRNEGAEERVDNAESESERRRMDEKQQDWRWDSDQERACWIATTSASKLEQCAPAGKEKENVEEQEEQEMNTPEPPGPKVPRTDPSVQMVRSAWGSEERWLVAKVERTTGGSVRLQGRERDRETLKVGGDHGGKGGQRRRGSRGEDGGGVRG